jgi:membrane-anchored glycerophosphoryl diester phosphodiesterase (GDPDase)
MRVGEMLDTAIRLYRRNWKVFMGIVGVVWAPFILVQSFLTREAVPGNPFDPSSVSTVTPDQATTLAIVSIVFGVLSFVFIQPLLAGAVARAAVQVYRGESPELRSIYRFALSRLRAILWVTVLTGLAVLVGFVLLVIPGIIAFIRLTFGTAVVVVEDERGTRALRRSWRLAKGHFWKILGTLLLAGILTSIVGGILQIPLTLASFPLEENGWILRAIGAAVAGVIAQPFSALVSVLLYFDMRVRKEGLDLALAARELGLTT